MLILTARVAVTDAGIVPDFITIAQQAVELAIQTRCIVEFDFNGTLLQAKPVAKANVANEVQRLHTFYHK